MEKAARGKRASENQKEFLINYLEENLDIANDKFVTADGAKFKETKWKELAASLNALGGTQKDGGKWKKYWSDLRLHTRAKYSEIKQAEQRSGINGLSRLKALSPLEERIIKIITIEAVDGDGTPEVGFDVNTIVNATLNEGVEQSTIYILPDIDNVATGSADISSNASITNIASTRRRKRKVPQADAPQFQKFFKIEEKKLAEMETSNAILKEQLEATKNQTYAIEANTKMKENILVKLSELINIIGQKNNT